MTSSPGNSPVGFLGGTGPEGRGLALRLAMAGHRVLIGSRDAGRARAAAAGVAELASSSVAGTGPIIITGGLNPDVAATADVVFVAVPYDGHRETLQALKDHLAGKIVVDVVAPLAFSKGRARAVAVQDGSAAQEARAVLPGARVVSAFQTISAQDLLVPDKAIDSDVVVCADDEPAKRTVMDLAAKIEGVRAVDGGGLENARYVEDFTALLLNINRIYKAHSAIKIVGI